MSEKHYDESKPEVKECGSSSNSRRKLLKGAVAAPVFLTVASRPIFARNCSVSGAISGNLSDPSKIFVCDGRTPGYWGEHPLEWGALGYNCGSCKEGYSGMHCTHNAYNNDGTPFHCGKGFAGHMYRDKSMMRVVQLGGKYDKYQLGAHAVAALLNAAYFGKDVFGYDEEYIRRLWSEKAYVEPERLKQFYQLLNENKRNLAESLGFGDFTSW